MLSQYTRTNSQDALRRNKSGIAVSLAWVVLISAFFRCGNTVTRFLDDYEESQRKATSMWAKKRTITINNATIGQLTDYPLLVLLDTARINYSLCQTNGQDLRFYDADGVTELSYEIERWNTSGTSLVWVKIPQVDAGSTSDGIVMRYGNPHAGAGSSAAAVWSSEYKGVYHMGDGNDSTANANHATASSNVTYSNTAQLGGRGFFDAAVNPYVQIPITGLTTAAGTIEAVVEMRTAPTAANYRFAFSHTNTGSERIHLGSVNTPRSFFGTIGDNAAGVASATSFTLNTLTYVSITYTGLSFTMYFNGVQTDTGTAFGHTGILPSAKIGNYGATPTATWAWDGYIHEMRVIAAAKSADYMKANNRAITDTYLTFGTETEN